MSADYTKHTSNRAAAAPRDELHIDHPPRGIKMERTYDGTTVIRARTFSASAFGLLFFAVFWNSITSIFVAVAIAMTAAKFGFDTGFNPKWENDSPPPLWLLWLFLTPFILIGLGTLGAVVFKLFGRCEIRLGAGGGSVFKGVGSLGRTQHFSPQSVKSVYLRTASYTVNRQAVYHWTIEMNNGREIKLPSIGKMRETWLAFALKKILGIEQQDGQ